MRQRRWVLAGLLALAVVGCARRSTPPGPDVAAGVHRQASYIYMRWEEGLRIMIWHDIVDASMGRGVGAAGEERYQYGGVAKGSEGREFTWEVETEDGQTAEFRIGGARYDLADGRLFVVRTGPGEVEVEQLQRDLSDVQTNYESCVAFAESDVDLRAFLDETPAAD